MVTKQSQPKVCRPGLWITLGLVSNTSTRQPFEPLVATGDMLQSSCVAVIFFDPRLLGLGKFCFKLFNGLFQLCQRRLVRLLFLGHCDASAHPLSQ